MLDCQRITLSGISRRAAGLGLLIALLGCVVMVTGCGEPRRRVITTWRGDFTAEAKVNEKIRLGRPVLDAISWNGEPGTFQVEVKQQQETTFDLEKRYEKVAAVRHLSAAQTKQLRGDSAKSAHIGLFLGTLWMLPPVGATASTAAAAMNKKKAEQRKETEKNAIEQLKEDAPTVTVPMDYRWRTLQTEYKREVIGEEAERIESGREEETVRAAQLLLKLENSQNPRIQKKSRTDDSGMASFRLARTPAQVLALEPIRWNILAKWGGKWEQVGAIRLTREWIADALQSLREQRLHATGKPKLPPVARTSLQISKGRLEAGASSDFALTVLNIGHGEFYGLQATTESAVPALDGLKFKFGKLDPGEGLTLVGKVHIRRDQRAGQALVRFRWSELNGFEPDPVEAYIVIKGSSGQ